MDSIWNSMEFNYEYKFYFQIGLLFCAKMIKNHF